MATEASPPRSSSKRKSNKKKKIPTLKPDADTLEALQWNKSHSKDDPFALLIGSNEGGFLSLEEIDESEYGLLPGSPEPRQEEPLVLSKSKKRTRRDANGSSGEDSSITGGGSEGKMEDKKKAKRKRKQKKKGGLKEEKGELVEEKVSG